MGLRLPISLWGASRSPGERSPNALIFVLTNTQICVRMVSVVGCLSARGVPHAPIVEARPDRWRGHRARRLHWSWNSPGDAATPHRLSPAAAGAADDPAGGDPERGVTCCSAAATITACDQQA